jgi:hypothetical protein
MPLRIAFGSFYSHSFAKLFNLIPTVHIWPHLANLTGTRKHSIELTYTARKDPLESGPKCRICPFLMVPLMTVPARMILFSSMYLSEIMSSVCSSSLFLISLTEVSRFKKLLSKSMFLPDTLETKKIGMTSSVDVIL